MSSALSDDGQRRFRRVDDLHANHSEMQEPDTGVSMLAELSDHRVRLERPDEDDAIHEHNSDSENASSPPGSIRENHDIMSENIKTKQLHKFGKSNNKPLTLKDQNLSDEGVSKEAHNSEVTALPPIAVISPIQPPPETSRSIQTFSYVYDKLFAEFKDEVVQEYGGMRGSYMGEYQGNYDLNTSRKEDKITEMHMAIKAQCDFIK